MAQGTVAEEFAYEPVAGWAKLPAGWSFKEIGGVGTDRHDNVYVFNRGEHPMMVFDRDGNSYELDRAGFTVTVPPVPGLVGYLQAITLSPGTGLDASNGLRVQNDF